MHIVASAGSVVISSMCLESQVQTHCNRMKTDFKFLDPLYGKKLRNSSKKLEKIHVNDQGPVQSIVSLTSLFRDQLIKCFTTLLLNTLIFFC